MVRSLSAYFERWRIFLRRRFNRFFFHLGRMPRGLGTEPIVDLHSNEVQKL